MSSSPRKRISARSPAAQPCDPGLHGAARECGRELGGAHDGDGNATRNAGEMIHRQTLTYNRSRQAMITKELIEIISGAEAL